MCILCGVLWQKNVNYFIPALGTVKPSQKLKQLIKILWIVFD